MNPPIHLVKLREPTATTAKCGAVVAHSQGSIWWTDITCRSCLTLMEPSHDTNSRPTEPPPLGSADPAAR